MIKIQTLSKKAFGKFGVILEQPNKKKIFSVLTGDKGAPGWRIGYLVYFPERIKSLEKHPESMETFEPVSGTSIMLLAEEKTPHKIEAFLLDKPVCLSKSVWHAVKVLSKTAEIKITENYEVESIHYKLKKPIDVGFA